MARRYRIGGGRWHMAIYCVIWDDRHRFAAMTCICRLTMASRWWRHNSWRTAWCNCGHGPRGEIWLYFPVRASTQIVCTGISSKIIVDCVTIWTSHFITVQFRVFILRVQTIKPMFGLGGIHYGLD